MNVDTKRVNESRPQRVSGAIRIGWRAPLLLAVLIAGGCILAALSNRVMADGSNKPEERFWGGVGMSTAAGMLMAAGAAAMSLVMRSRRALKYAIAAALICLVGNIGLSLAGLRLVAEAERGGGEWQAWAVAAAWACGVIYPILLAIVCFALQAQLRAVASVLVSSAQQAVQPVAGKDGDSGFA